MLLHYSVDGTVAGSDLPLRQRKQKTLDTVGMHIDEVLRIEPSFEYDDFEEVYVSPKGVSC
ncbi:hypothetical protein PCURB6_12310 [Paenibacillus curdlanolyticus]|nr:hypothetical protein PCURB6_12310 [Paenibacillus curdlanolyticus]